MAIIRKRLWGIAALIVLFLGFFSVILQAAAEDFEIVANPRPVITVTFDEPVFNPLATLRRQLDTTAVPLVQLSSSDPNKVFRYQPSENHYLNDDEFYTFIISAYDASGMPGPTQTVVFQVQVPPVTIGYYYPKHGVSQTEDFTFKIKTDRKAAECRYSRAVFKDYTGMTDTFLIEDVGATIHYAENINVKEGNEAIFYAACNDTYGIVTDTISMKLSVDTTDPKILTLAAEPPEVIAALETSIKATTDDKTLCRASATSQGFDSMDKYFEGYNDSDAKAYNFSSARKITSSADGISDGNTYVYNVVCENLAGRRSAAGAVEFIVNQSKAFYITKIRPDNVVKMQVAQAQVFVDTNKPSMCYYGNTTEQVNSRAYYFDGSDTIHSAIFGAKDNVIKIPLGKSTVYALCEYHEEKDAREITLLYDKTKPDTDDIFANITDETGSMVSAQWQTDKIFGIATAYDKESGIDEFNYSLFDSDDIQITKDYVVPAINGRAGIKLTNLNMTDGEIYYLSVMAKNGAGMWSDDVKSNNVKIDIKLMPTDALKCVNKALDKDIGETDVDCGGLLCRGCKKDKLCSQDDDCSIGLECGSAGTCQEATELCGASQAKKCDAGKLCGENLDCKSGVCSQGLCAAADCFDDVKNGDESAPDCGGGKCEKCGKDFSCNVDDDCITGLCAENDGGEMVCSGKEDGESCQKNTECDSGFCDPVKNQCEIDSDADGLPDYWEKENFKSETAAEPEKDSDEDGFTNLQEFLDGTDPKDPESHKKVSCKTNDDCEKGMICDTSKSCSADSNNNGLPDWWEKKYFGCLDCVDPEADSDKDNLKNKEEYLKETDPNLADTDGDGYNDGAEIIAGTDPTDENDHPSSPTLLIAIIVAGMAVLGVGGYFAYTYFLKDKLAGLGGGAPELPGQQQGYSTGTSSARTPTSLSQAPVKKGPDLHKVFVEKQKIKQEKMSSVFDSFGGKKTDINVKPKTEAPRTEKMKEEKYEKHEKLTRVSEEKTGKKGSLFDKLSSLSKKEIEAPSRAGRISEFSKKKPGSLDKLSSLKSGSKSRLEELGKGKKSSSLSELSKLKKKSSSIDSLKKKSRK